MSEAHGPPGLPNVVDEAGETPPWVPRLGLALLLAAVLYVVVTRSLGDTPAPPTEAPPAPEAPATAAG